MKKIIFMMALLAGCCFLAEDAVAQKSFMKPPTNDLRKSELKAKKANVSNPTKVKVQNSLSTKVTTTKKSCEIGSLVINNDAPSSPAALNTKSTPTKKVSTHSVVTSKPKAQVDVPEQKITTTKKQCEINSLVMNNSDSSFGSVSKSTPKKKTKKASGNTGVPLNNTYQKVTLPIDGTLKKQ